MFLAHVSRACALVVFAALAGTNRLDARQGLAPPPPPAMAPPPMQGTGSIAVTVVSAATGRPVKGATVNAIVSTGDSTYLRTTLTDARGRALLVGLAKGRVRLSASHQGFISFIFGQDRPGDTTGTFIPLDENQRIENITLGMIRGSAIGGMITDEAGEGIVGVQVRAYRREFVSGKTQFTAFGTFDLTDDRGAYRIANLTPGDYIVGVVPRYLERDLPAASDESTDAPAIVRAEGATPGSVGAEAPAQTITIGENRVVEFNEWSPPPTIESADGRGFAYPPTFYPGTTATAAAFVIHLGPAEQRDGAVIRLEPVEVTRISGRVVDAQGKPPARVALALVPSGADDRVVIGDTIGTRVAPDGSFGFSFVPPGQYTIEAQGNAASTDPSQPPLAHPLWASVPVTVEGKPLSNLAIKLDEGTVLAGRIVFDGGRPASMQSLSTLRVVLEPRPTATSLPVSTLSAAIADDGRFRVAQVMPGEYRISMPSLPKDWRLVSAIVDGRDALDFGMKIRPHQDIDTAVFTVSNKLAELTGVARGADGRPSSRGTIVLFPTDTSLWMSVTSRIQALRPDSDGQFAFRQGLPGSYLVAITDAEPGQWRDPAFLEALRAHAATVTLRPGEKTVQDVK